MKNKVSIQEYKKILKQLSDKLNELNNNKEKMWYSFTNKKLWNFLDALKSIGVKEISEKDIEKTFNAINYTKLINGSYGIHTENSFITIDGKKYDCKQLNEEIRKRIIDDIKCYPDFNKDNLDKNGKIIVSEKFIEILGLSTMSFYAVIDLDQSNYMVIL